MSFLYLYKASLSMISSYSEINNNIEMHDRSQRDKIISSYDYGSELESQANLKYLGITIISAYSLE